MHPCDLHLYSVSEVTRDRYIVRQRPSGTAHMDEENTMEGKEHKYFNASSPENSNPGMLSFTALESTNHWDAVLIGTCRCSGARRVPPSIVSRRL
jgi:hypothetical protein